MADRIDIHAASSQTETFEYFADSDPTASTLHFELLADTSNSDDTGTWTAGTWGAYNSTTKKVDITTPTMGATGLTVTRGNSYKLWVKVGNKIELAAIVEAK